MTYWAWISLSYATFAVDIDSEGNVYNAAPIGRWMIGKHWSTIDQWVKKKQGIIYYYEDITHS